MAKILFSDAIDDEIRVKRWRNAIRGDIDRLVDKTVLDTLDINQKLLDYGHQLGISVAISILTQNIDFVRWPKDWIQAFKARWFPGWLKKLFPVKWERIDIRAIYPKAKLPDPVFKYTGRVSGCEQ